MRIEPERSGMSDAGDDFDDQADDFAPVRAPREVRPRLSLLADAERLAETTFAQVSDANIVRIPWDSAPSRLACPERVERGPAERVEG